MVEEFTHLAKPDLSRSSIGQSQQQQQQQLQQQQHNNPPRYNIMDRMMQIYSQQDDSQIQQQPHVLDQVSYDEPDFDQLQHQSQSQQRLTHMQVKEVFQDRVKIIKTQTIIPTPLLQANQSKLDVYILDGLVETIKKLLKGFQNLTFRIQLPALQWDVRRNDQDFNTLHKYLVKTYPNILIPPISQFKGQRKFDTVFIKKRGRIIEKFLRSCLRSVELKGCQALVQFLSSTDKKDYEALIKTLEREVTISQVKQYITQCGEIQINESQFQYYVAESQKYPSFVKQFEGNYRRLYQQMKRLGEDLSNISQTLQNVHESVESLSQTYQQFNPEKEGQGLPTLLNLVAKAMNLWSQSYLNQKQVIGENMTHFFQYYALYGEQISEFYKQISTSLEDLTKKEKALNERKERLFNSKDIGTWDLKQQAGQLTPEQKQILLSDKAQAMQVMLPVETGLLTDLKDIFTVLVQSFKQEISRQEDEAYVDIKNQLDVMIEPIIKSYQNHLMIWNQAIINKLKSSTNQSEQVSPEQIRLFPSTENGAVISQKEFQNIDPNDLEIYVVRPVKKIVSVLSHVEYLFEVKVKNMLRYKVQKRFRDFDSLDQVLKIRFENLKFPEIPSKTQIFKKEQTRMKYYEELFSQFKKYAIEYPNMRQKLLILIYKLLITESVPIKVCTIEKQDQQRYDSLMGSGISDGKHGEGLFSLEEEEENEEMQNDFSVFLGYMEDNTENTLASERTRFGATEVSERPSQQVIEQERNRRKTRRGSINQEKIDKFKDIDLLEKSKIQKDVDLYPGIFHQTNNGISQLKNRDVLLGYCWVKLPMVNIWQKFFARIQDSAIKFCKDVEVNEFTICYVIYNCLIETINIKIPEWDNKNHQAFIIRHEFDAEWLLIALEDEKTFFEKRKEILGKTLEYSKNSMDIINETNRYAFGKVQIKIKQLCDVQNIGKLFVRVRLGPYYYETKRVKAPSANSYKFNQNFIIPITNRFDQIYIELVSYITSGLFQGQHKENVIREFCIPLPFLKQETFKDKLIQYSLNLEDIKVITHDNLMQRLGMQQRHENDKPNHPKFELQITDLSQLTTVITFNPNRDVVEDRPRQKEYSRKQINIVISKMVLTIYKITDIENLEKYIFYFHYPNLSKFLRIFLVFFILYFDSQYLLSYVLGIVILMFIFQNEQWQRYTMPILNMIFFSSKNEYLNEEKASKIITFRQDSIKANTRTIVNSTIETDKDMKKKSKKNLYHNGNQKDDDQQFEENTEQAEKYERKKNNIFQKYRDLQDKISVVVFFFDMITDFVEKFTMLLTWQDQNASKFLLAILIVIFLVVSFLPLRYFIILAILKKFNRGSSYYKRRYTGNKEAIKIELRNFMLANGFLKYDELRKFGEQKWMLSPWPLQRAFEKKLINYLQDKLYILVPKGFTQEFKNPSELIESAGHINQVLQLRPRDENEWELRNNRNLYRKSPNPLVFLYNFVMNNISSFIYFEKNKKYLKLDECL